MAQSIQLAMQSNQLISLGRINRLANSRCLLGEPDIISIKQIKSASSLFNRDKKIEDIQENYINGLIFPTTAHFSSFISSRYRAKDPNKHTVKAKLFMFDAYGEKDIQIQISIPGSMEVKAYNLKGQPMPFSNPDYERAYYSSFLRSFYPMNYPGIILYHLINRVEIMRPIIKNFMVFSQKHELRELNNEFQLFRRPQFQENEARHNLSLQILANYLLENSFGNLFKLILEDLRKQKSQRYYQLEMEWKLKEKKYSEILYKTSEKLIISPHIHELKQFQIRALYKVGKYAQIAVIGRNLIESGGTTDQISKIILRSLIEIGEDKKYLKTLNLLLNLKNGHEKTILQVSHIHHNNSIISFAEEMKDIKCISQHSELCFPFDNAFLNRSVDFMDKREILQKNTKEGFTFNILQKVEESLNNNPPYYDTIIYYTKQRGWSTLVKNRANCFWLQSDFASQSQSMRMNHQQRFDDNFSFFQKNFQQAEELQEMEFQMQDGQPKQIEESKQIPRKLQQQNENNQQDFDGNLSQHQYPKQMIAPSKCTSRMQPINTARKFNQQQRKIQCCSFMEQVFFSLFHDLKLQNSLQSWQEKLKQAESSTFNSTKKQIAAIIYLKKGFLNRKLQQNKKCEQSFRSARKLSDSYCINLVATYQLILLYIQNKNVKGVQFYLVELVKVLKTMGIQTFDIVPQWAKPILQFVADNEGLSIIKNIHPLFKCVFGFYLRSNLTEQEVNQVLKLKK